MLSHSDKNFCVKNNLVDKEPVKHLQDLLFTLHAGTKTLGLSCPLIANSLMIAGLAIAQWPA